MHTHRRALVLTAAATALIGGLAAFAVAAGLPAPDRTLATVAAPVQLLLSVGSPFLGAVATSSLHRQPGQEARATLVRTMGWALGFAAWGSALSAAAVAALPSASPAGRWADALPVLLGSILMQAVAMLTGTGFGLLLRRPVVASLATVILPLALWPVLGAVAPGARLWLTPFEGANLLLAGTMASSQWLPHIVMVSIWGVGSTSPDCDGSTGRPVLGWPRSRPEALDRPHAAHRRSVGR